MIVREPVLQVSDPPNVLDELRPKVGSAEQELEDHFIDAAKKDLGVAE